MLTVLGTALALGTCTTENPTLPPGYVVNSVNWNCNSNGIDCCHIKQLFYHVPPSQTIQLAEFRWDASPAQYPPIDYSQPCFAIIPPGP